jgi:ATP-dependent Clp protease ATP-binding subunit ClpA
MENKEAQERLDILNKELIEKAEGTSLIKEEVTREDIAEVAKWTGIPIENAGRTRKTVASGRRTT